MTDVWSLNHTLEVLYLKQDQLFEQADQVATEFWDKEKEENAKRPQSQRGRMGIRVRRRKGGVQIEWFQLKTRSQGGQTIAKYIKKGHRAKIPKRNYAPYCQDWEVVMVERAEEQLAPIRRQLSHIKNAIVAIKAQQREEESAEQLEEGSEAQTESE